MFTIQLKVLSFGFFHFIYLLNQSIRGGGKSAYTDLFARLSAYTDLFARLSAYTDLPVAISALVLLRLMARSNVRTDPL